MEKFLAGIVLYNPDIERLKENIEAIINQVDKLIFVDNHSSNTVELNELLGSYPKIAYIKNSTNCGIAKALNQICNYAILNDYSYVITLDQDSVCPNNIIFEYRKYISPTIGILCPVIKDRNYDYKTDSTGEETTEVRECITSASCLNIGIWEKINGFDESMFIDGVDFDYCDRVSKAGGKIVRVNSVILLHEIGHITPRRFLFWKVDVKNHSAKRKFYIARNTIYRARKSKKLYKIIKSYAQITKQLVWVGLYEDDKRNKCQSIISGVKEGRKAIINLKWMIS